MSITSRINEMSSHIEQAYDELQGLGADLTNVNKNIENISMVLDDIYDSLPSVSGEGTSLTLDDTRVGKIKSTLKGNTSQDGTPTPTTPIPVNVVSGDNEIIVNGKNFLNNINFVKGRLDNGVLGYENNTTNLITTQDSVEFTTNANYRGVTSDYIVVNPSTDYLYQQKNSLSGLYLSLACYDSNKAYLGSPTITNIGLSSRKITMLANTKFFRINMQLNTAGTIKLEELMLFKGSTASTYEPYQGNTYNIDLPVENLLPPPSNSSSSTGVGNMTLTWNTSNDFHLSGSATSTGNVWGGTVASDYTIKEGDYLHLCNDSVPSGTIQFVGLTPTTTQAFAATINSKNKVLDLTSYVGKTIHSVFFYCVSGASADMTMTPMIVNGMPKVLSFTPYGTTPIELCKIGNYQDYFYKDSGKWYLHKEIGKVVLNGSETWYKSTSYPGNYYCQNGVPNAILHDINCFSNLTNVFWYSVEQLASGDNGIMLEGGSSDRTIDFKISSISTLADFKTFLGNNNLILYYTLDTPTNTEITYQPLIDQLNELEKAMSKDGQTNISQVNNDLPFIISASALKEWQESTSLNSTLSMVNPLSLGNTLNTQENDIQPIEVDNIEPLEEEENEES